VGIFYGSQSCMGYLIFMGALVFMGALACARYARACTVRMHVFAYGWIPSKIDGDMPWVT
jgi:hypothetical protein